jgi:hypothetical protein
LPILAFSESIRTVRELDLFRGLIHPRWSKSPFFSSG